MRNLSYYEPSSNMLKAFEENFTDEFLAKTSSLLSSYLISRQLDYDNISTVLSTLLSIEDINTLRLFLQLTQFNVMVKISKPNELCLELTNTKTNVGDVVTPDIDQVVLVPRDSFLNLKLSDQSTLDLLLYNENESCVFPYVFVITKVTRKCVYFTDIDVKEKLIPIELFTKSYNAIFRPLRIPFRLMCLALEMLENGYSTRRYIFPVPNTEKVDHKVTVLEKLPICSLFNSSIATNAEQLQAVQQIVAGPNPQAPYIVFGPPGTGKTTTIVEAILQVCLQENSRILIIAGSNSTCDTIALKICEVIASSERLQELVRYPKEKNMLPTWPLIRFYSLVYDMKKLDPNLKKYFKCIAATKDNFMSLHNFKISVATLCGVARMRYYAIRCPFTHIFIDEAAASSEAEALMGIAGVKSDNCHVILSGDHKQLGAVIKSNRAESLGLGQSLMERLLLNKLYEVDNSGNYDRTLQSRLRQNYRSHPEIVGIFNKLYYNCELIPMAPPSQVNQAAKWSVLPNGKFPILFQVTHGITEREAQSNSSLNKLEAQQVCWYVKSLLEDGLGGDIKVQQEEIGVVTPYLGQCRLLQRMLRQRGHRKVEVGSVESYQGREKPIIIVSLVSSFKHPYFLSNPRRVNVFLSRAKSLMILIGNPISLSKNKDFKFIIGQCKLQGNFLTKKKTVKRKSKKTVKSQSNEDRKSYLQADQLPEEEIVDQQDKQDEAGEIVLINLQNQLNDLDICETSTG